MATSYLSHKPARTLFSALVVALAVLATPVEGRAAPDTPVTSGQAQEQLGDLNRQLEVVTEQYNDARIVLEQRRAEVDAAQTALADARAGVADMDDEVRLVARNAYTGQRAGMAVLLMSASPQELLDRMNTLETIAGHNETVLQEFAAAETRAADLARQATRALDRAEEASAGLDATRAQIEAQLPMVEALLASLTEQERQAVFAAEAAAAAAAPDRASRAGDRSQPAEQDPPNDTDGPSPVSAPTEAAQIAVDTAYAQLGDPYVWAADGPDSFDCSGLTMYSYAAAGISLPHSSQMQYQEGVSVSRDQLLPGDLVFFYSPISHVAIYIGDGNMITAPQTGDVVKIQSIGAMPWAGARRIAVGG